MSDSATPKPERCWYYFSLRALLVPVLLVVWGCGPSEGERAMDGDNQELVGLEMKEVGDATVLTFKDAKLLDEKNVQVIRGQLLGLVEQNGRKRFILDFSNVQFMSEEALGMLVALDGNVRRTNGRLRLCSLSSDIHEVLTITHMDKIFDIQKDVEEALKRPYDSDADNNRRHLWAQAIFLQAWGEHDKAIAHYDELIRLDPKDAATYMARASAWSTKGDRDKAIADYTEAIRLDSNHVLAYSRRGDKHSDKGEFDQAIADYTKAIQLDPNNPGIYVQRANALAAKGEPERAIADYTEAIRVAPDSYDTYLTYLRRGVAYWEMGEYENALADYTEAIRLNPEDGSALYRRGLAFEKMNKQAKAEADFAKAKQLGYEPE